ncbi:MAG: 16S rRNA (guanine(966)-N(2))-methyltransferase RsmD [Acholeplasmatales bacterium]|nr:16S rRNA (guanine(966)-N(2))-methyltransferase RsmD [Acholeplasmatales bacterium]
MRIIAGSLRHRIIDMVNIESTRETQDKVRGAIFNMVGPYLDCDYCLDLFSGSGAMAIEAYSRGAKHIVLNDLNKKAYEVSKNNCVKLGIKDFEIYNMDYLDFIKNDKHKYDLIILDPPYKMNDISDILESVKPLLSSGGKVIFEMGIDSNYPESLDYLELIKNKEYGIKRVVVYKEKK